MSFFDFRHLESEFDLFGLPTKDKAAAEYTDEGPGRSPETAMVLKPGTYCINGMYIKVPEPDKQL